MQANYAHLKINLARTQTEHKNLAHSMQELKQRIISKNEEKLALENQLNALLGELSSSKKTWEQALSAMEQDKERKAILLEKRETLQKTVQEMRVTLRKQEEKPQRI